MNPWYEIDTPCITAHAFPAALIDLALDRDLEPHRLLRGTGIFMEDVLSAELTIRPAQCFELIRNLRQLMPGADTAFLAGHRLFPGNFGPAGIALQHANNLGEALNLLTRHAAVLSPLLTPELILDTEYACLHWHDSCGASDALDFVRDMMMTAITALTRAQTVLAPWEYWLPAGTPHPEQHNVHWGTQVFTHTHLCIMKIHREALHQPWPRASASTLLIARHQAEAAQATQANTGFIRAVDTYLSEQIANNPSLDQLALAFGMSPATLKRKLKKHHSHFQERFDLVRKQLAIDWLLSQQQSIDTIACRLHFHDSRNLRRAFKRWTGCLPSHFTLPRHG